MRHINKRSKSGQALLITIMILATVLTVVMSVTFRGGIETQVNKAEEDAQRALAAAEAGIEQALRSGNVADVGSLVGDASISGNATVSTVASQEFNSPLVQKDGMYTLYLSTPAGTADEPDFDTLTTAYNSQAITLCFNAVGVEVSFVKSTGDVVRYALNPAVIDNATAVNSSGTCPAGETYTNKHTFSGVEVGTQNLYMLVRVIGGSSKVGVRGAADLPLQGRLVVSEASTSTGVNKKVQLFQSYPQIPADFFVTSF